MWILRGDCSWLDFFIWSGVWEWTPSIRQVLWWDYGLCAQNILTVVDSMGRTIERVLWSLKEEEEEEEIFISRSQLWFLKLEMAFCVIRDSLFRWSNSWSNPTVVIVCGVEGARNRATHLFILRRHQWPVRSWAKRTNARSTSESQQIRLLYKLQVSGRRFTYAEAPKEANHWDTNTFKLGTKSQKCIAFER